MYHMPLATSIEILRAVDAGYALVQAIECFVSLKTNTLSDLLAINAIEIIGKNLKQAVENWSHRTDISKDNIPGKERRKGPKPSEQNRYHGSRDEDQKDR